MTVAPATLNRTVPWYGAKGRKTLRDRIIHQVGTDHKGFAEGCCGSLAVTLAKKRVPMEVAWDLNGDLVNLVRVIMSARWVELKELADRALVCSDTYLETREKWKAESEQILAPSIDAVGDEHVTAAFHFLLASWQGINGVTGTGRGNCQLARRYTVGGGHSGTRWRGVGDSLPAWHDRLKDVLIDRVDVVEEISRLADDGSWAVYLDPPYYRKGDQYVHDFTPQKHADLAAACRAKKNTRIVVSYYDEPEVRELYRGWTIDEAPMSKALVNQGRRDVSTDDEDLPVAPEILLINGPSYVGGGLFE